MKDKHNFRNIIYGYYHASGRLFPWRETDDPYKILVSEIMLQQTQTERVIGKYLEFLAKFPTIESLSDAPFAEVLKTWQGLGYNRRAKSLKKTAEILTAGFDGKVPSTIEELQSLPGIGYATACSISAFAFNLPVVFIETNIRRVFIHFFFKGKENITDKEILPYVEETLDRGNPGKWYNALMDYGVKLKNEVSNPNQRSAHYTKQAPFRNSNREVRGRILKILTETGDLEESAILEKLRYPKQQVNYCLKALEQEGFLVCDSGRVYLSE